jgi:hypothetical protein
VADKIGQVLGSYATVFKKIETEQWQSEKCKAIIWQTA